ncbi:hypothetical protein [Cohnella cellulosilytica]|uniref:GGDEF domain-containing protein n=1 Tax=Cohnella cellulosilytica TaxID=986710 RepID=A0ABW2FNK3_9BACL
MKIEVGESLLLSWLRHIKECQIVQTNWKASSKWELKNTDNLGQLMQVSSNLFSQKYGYDLYKGTKSLSQLIGQAEVDVLGIHYENNQSYIYAIDVAFHEAGLNYGASQDETIARVVKKCLRTAMCISGYFEINYGTIIFASPKINPSVAQALQSCVGDINFVLAQSGLNFNVRIIANEEFSERILEPVLNILGDIADTSELFMRSLQMYNLFATNQSKQTFPRRSSVSRKISPEHESIAVENLEGLDEMKIGVIVRTVLRKILQESKLSEEEIANMQTKPYSKETFDIQYPLLLKKSSTQTDRPDRYYAEPLKINSEEYFLCSEWYEIPANNDRPYLLKWLSMHVNQG